FEVDQRVGGELRLGEQPASPRKPGMPLAPFDFVERLRAFDLSDRVEVHDPPLLSPYFRSSSEAGPDSPEIRVGHCLEPNGTSGGRKGSFPRAFISEMM